MKNRPTEVLGEGRLADQGQLKYVFVKLAYRSKPAEQVGMGRLFWGTNTAWFKLVLRDIVSLSFGSAGKHDPLSEGSIAQLAY